MDNSRNKEKHEEQQPNGGTSDAAVFVGLDRSLVTEPHVNNRDNREVGKKNKKEAEEK